MDQHLSNPRAVAQEGERIYRERYQAGYETHHMGDFVVIDVQSGLAYRGKTAIDAVQLARTSVPDGVFHLMRVGEPGAFRLYIAGVPSYLPPT